MTDRPGLDFSFSWVEDAGAAGLARFRPVRPDQGRHRPRFQAPVVDTLAIKCERALDAAGCDTLVVAGGVGANKRLRAKLQAMAERRGGRVAFPRPALCTDNGAMIAFAGALRLAAGQRRTTPRCGSRRAGTWRACRRCRQAGIRDWRFGIRRRAA